MCLCAYICPAHVQHRHMCMLLCQCVCVCVCVCVCMCVCVGAKHAFVSVFYFNVVRLDLYSRYIVKILCVCVCVCVFVGSQDASVSWSGNPGCLKHGRCLNDVWASDQDQHTENGPAGKPHTHNTTQQHTHTHT